MPYQDFENNWKIFTKLIDKLSTQDAPINPLVKKYVEQNLIVLNDILVTSIDHLERLQSAKSPNDVICTQAHFTNEMTKKLTLSTQQFLNQSLGNIADYNDWLKAHCDLATD